MSDALSLAGTGSHPERQQCIDWNTEFCLEFHQCILEFADSAKIMTYDLYYFFFWITNNLYDDV